MDIKTIRQNKHLTQSQAAELLGLSLRTYQNYESGASTRDKFKIANILRILNEYEKYSENSGILTQNEIIEICEPIFKKYKISYSYLFGSYANNEAKENSDIDLLVSNEPKGFDFIDLQNDLNKALHKNIDLVRIDDTKNNEIFLNEILMKGIKIYEKH